MARQKSVAAQIDALRKDIDRMAAEKNGRIAQLEAKNARLRDGITALLMAPTWHDQDPKDMDGEDRAAERLARAALADSPADPHYVAGSFPVQVYAWAERMDLVSEIPGFDIGSIVEIEALYQGPPVFMTGLYNPDDEIEDVEVRWFRSRAEAEAAVAEHRAPADEGTADA